ncbi:MAG TPA: N-6 DNA methylase, partial [Mycobacteriales bacterium]
MTSTGIARMAGVGRAAVSNWRRRHADFPEPVGGSASSPTFDLAAVERWLSQQGKLVESSLAERTWRRIEVFSSAPQITDAFCLTGALLLTRPKAGLKADRASIPTPARLLRDLRTRSQPAAEALAPIVPPAWSQQQKELLLAVTELADQGDRGETFEFLHWRCVTARGVSALDATPDAVAELMADLAGVGQTVLDFACGTGTMLRTQIRRAVDAGVAVRCFGQEPDPASARVALLRLLFAQDSAR